MTHLSEKSHSLKHTNNSRSKTSSSSSTFFDHGKTPKGIKILNSSRKMARNGVFQIRLVLLFLLLFLTLILGIGGFYIITESEQQVANSQYETLILRALELAQEAVARRRVAIKSMARVAASAFPSLTMWPNVAIPAFEAIANYLTSTSSSIELGFYPKVQPEQIHPGQQASFEAFAYDYFYHQRNLPFPQDTAVHNFGRGIWSTQMVPSQSFNMTSRQVHDTTGETTLWNSSNKILFPELQTTNEGQSGKMYFMFNVHSIESKGQPIDEVINCTNYRKTTQNYELDCGAVSDILSWNRESFLIQPIHPAKDLLEFTGVIISRVSWDIIIETLLKDSLITGIDVVLEASDRSYSYQVTHGVAVFSGDGDRHSKEYDGYRRTITLQGDLICGGLCTEKYTLSVYPNASFFKVYTTSSPIFASVGAVLIVLVTSLIFLFYDFLVQREFSANEHILEAKRQFTRFVSHEVRTPLNAVCMGLSLLNEELIGANSAAAPAAEIATTCNQQFSDIETPIMRKETNTDSSNNNDNIALFDCDGSSSLVVVADEQAQQSKLDGWLSLIDDIRTSASVSVDVLNDLLNYDRIESGSFTLELTIFSIGNLIIETSKEFRLSAMKKHIAYELDMVGNVPLLADDLESAASFRLASPLPPSLSEMQVVADKIRITQMLRNLVSNAMKFTSEGGHVVVRTSFVNKLPNEKRGATTKSITDQYKLVSGQDVTLDRVGVVKIEIIDNGAGMSKEQLRELFRDGVQFNLNDLQAGQGSGLGLYISDGIVKQHRGNLEVFSKGLGLGTTFSVFLPLYKVDDNEVDETHPTTTTNKPVSLQSEEESCRTSSMEESMRSEYEVTPSYDNNGKQQQQPQQQQQHESSSSSLRILVVDDIMTNRKFLKRFLLKRGHVVDEAENGRLAVDAVIKATEDGDNKVGGYDTILMDYEMPILKGPDAAKEIRELGCDSFIVGLTGNVMAEDVNYFLSCGANFVLPKPVDFKKLEDLWVEHDVLVRA